MKWLYGLSPVGCLDSRKKKKKKEGGRGRGGGDLLIICNIQQQYHKTCSHGERSRCHS